jgi:uncharacterized protein YdeI (BOF family)
MLNIQQIVEAVTALPEIIKDVPLDKLQEIMPSVTALVQAAKEAGVVVEAEEIMSESTEEETPEMEEPTMDEEMSKEEEEKKPVQDSAAFKDALTKGISDAVSLHGYVVDKAKNFLDDTYSFADKKTCKIMRDALATQHGAQKFEDSELKVAFKMLTKVVDHSAFGKTSKEGLDLLKDKEL